MNPEGRRIPGRAATTLILTLFVLSGAAGLVYEIVWTRMLTLVFGNTVHAASTVIASFMGGLALGSWFFGRMADRRKDMLRLYGILEAGIGIFALLIPFFLRGLNVVYGGLFTAFGEQTTPFFAARFVLSMLLLLIPTILMGATLPILTRFFVSRRASLGREVAKLYALNTLGATAGCFAAGFLLIEKLGVTASNYVAAAISLTVAALILILSRIYESGTSAATPPGRAETETAPAPAGPSAGPGYAAPLRRLILVCVALVGFTSLAYQVIWTRVIIYVVSASIEAFAVVLTTFLAGIGIGSLLVARRVDGWRRLLAVFGAIEITIGLAAIASIPLLANLHGFSAFFFRQVDPGFWGWTAVRFITTGLVIGVPTLLMGAAFPVATSGYIRALKGLGRNVGVLYAMSTIGAVAGSLAAGFLLLPALGAQRALMVIALLNLAVGVVLWSAEPGRRRRGMAGATAVAAAGFLLGAFLIPSHTFHKLFNESRSQTEMIYCSEGVTATVTVHQYPPGTNQQDDLMVICTNGVDVAGSDYMLRTTQLLQGHLPLLLQKEGARVMQVGFGSGETSRVVLLEGASKLDAIEICAGLVRAAPLFGAINDHFYRDPRVRIILMDAKNYALLTGETYDIIMNDSIHPRVAGNASLYTVDYFEDCRKRIAPGGFMSSWFPVYGMRVEELRMIIRSFQTVFPHATLWMAHNVVNRHALLLAPVGDTPLRIDYEEYHRRISIPAVAADLASIDMDDPEFFISSLVMDEDALREYSQGAELNTDEHPLLEYRVPKHYGTDEYAWADILESLLPYRSDVRPLLVNLPGDREERQALETKLGRYFVGNEHALRGMIRGLRGDTGSLDDFLAAEALCPDHPAVKLARSRHETQLDERVREVRANPDDPGTRSRLGIAYWRIGRLREAEGELERAFRFDPENPEIAKWLGDLRRNLGENDRAIESYRRSLALQPGNVGAMIGLSAVLESTGDQDEAVRLYREAAALGGAQSDIQIGLGMLEVRLGHTDEAAAAFRQALVWTPHAVDALNGLALIEAEKENLDEAVSLFRKAMEVHPRGPDAWNNLAWIYAEREIELDEALRFARHAVELDPAANTYDTLAWVHFKRNEFAPARLAALKAIELSPEREQYRELLGKIEAAM